MHGVVVCSAMCCQLLRHADVQGSAFGLDAYILAAVVTQKAGAVHVCHGANACRKAASFSSTRLMAVALPHTAVL